MAVDTLGHRLAPHVTAADEQDRAQVGQPARDVRAAAGETRSSWRSSARATPASRPRATRASEASRCRVVKLPEARRGFVLPPRRRVVERSFAWPARFRRPARDYEPLAETLRGLHFVAFAIAMLRRLASWDS